MTKKTFLPHLAALVSFLLIAFIYCSPVTESKQIMGHDTEGWLGMSKEIIDYNDNNDDAALWTNSMFGGMPAYQISVKFPPSILSPINVAFKIFPNAIYMLFLYMLGFYIMLQAFRINPWLSMAMAVAFAFGSYNLIIIAVGHNTKAVVIAYMAPLIGSIIYAFRQNKWTGAVLTALFLALAIQGNHLQITYYTLIILIIFGLVEFIYAIKEKRQKEFFISFGVLLAAVLVAVGINANRLITTQEYAKHTMRGKTNNLTIDATSTQENLDKDYITNWSYGIDETFTLLIPNFKGSSDAEMLSPDSHTAKELRNLGVRDVEGFLKNQPLPTYFGTQPGTSGPVYAGAIICFLFVMGLMLVEGKNKWWILGAFILSVLLAWGKNFMPLTNFFIDYVPYYGKFRAVSMTLVITTFVMVLMAALGLAQFFKNGVKSPKNLQAIYISAGVTGGLCLLFALFPSLADIKGNFVGRIDASLTGDYGFMQKTLPLDRMAMVSSDAFRSFVFIALSFALLWFYNKSNKISQNAVIAVLAILLLADMMPIAKRYLNDNNFTPKRIGSYFTPTQADKMVLQDRSYYRVLDMTQNIFNSARPSYFHKSIGGYHAAKLRRYQELINIYLTGEIQNIGVSFGKAQSTQSVEPVYDELAQSQILNMLNMRYLIYHGDAEPITNIFANGNAWFVSAIHIADNADEEMLKLGTINTKEEAVVDKEFARFVASADNLQTDSLSTIELTSYSPNVLTYKSVSNTPQYAVFSEIYYEDGWNAYIDGKPAPYFRVNYLLRGMSVPAGEHKIEFRFEPKSVQIGNIISVISSVLLALAILALIYVKYKNSRKESVN